MRLDEARSVLASRLRERLLELQMAVATRVYAISDPHGVAARRIVYARSGGVPIAEALETFLAEVASAR